MFEVTNSHKILVVDDMPERHAWFKNKFAPEALTHAWTFTEAIEALQNNQFDVLFLDHDLGDNPDIDFDVEYGMYRNHVMNGEDIARCLVTNVKDWDTELPEAVFVHSVNSVGANQIAWTLENHIQFVHVVPFTSFVK